jgi:hypothetical protein
MDLSLSESQRELVDLAEQFAKNEIAPIASQCDQSQSIQIKRLVWLPHLTTLLTKIDWLLRACHL